MAGRGRPRKEDVIAKKEAQARAEGKTYGELAAEEQRKAVKVEQNDGIERQKVSERQAAKATMPHMPGRARKALERTIVETKEDIQSHKDCIQTIQKEIDQHIGCIRTHEQAIKELEKELAEEEKFLKCFQG